MLRLLVAAALLRTGQPRLVYEPDADFYGADEITVEVTTDADADNASTVVPVEVRGTWTLSTEGTGTRLCSVTEVTVKARLVGRLVEGIIARQLESAEAALPRDIQDQLD